MAELVNLGAQLDQLSLRVEQLVRLSEGLNRRLISAVDETSGLIATLCAHHDEVRQIYQLSTARHSLKTAVQKAQRFMDQFYEITFLCSAESELLLSRTGVNSDSVADLGNCKGGAACRGVRGHPPPEKF